MLEYILRRSLVQMTVLGNVNWFIKRDKPVHVYQREVQLLVVDSK